MRWSIHVPKKVPLPKCCRQPPPPPDSTEEGSSKIGSRKIKNDDFNNEQVYSIPEQLVAELFACISGRAS